MVAPSRNRLSTRSGSSVFYHVLESNEQSWEEEIHDRNFRDLIHVMIPASIYVHVIFESGLTSVSNVERFLLLPYMDYLPEVNNAVEERMLGVLHPDYYVHVNIAQYTDEELIEGEHLILGSLYYMNI